MFYQSGDAVLFACYLLHRDTLGLKIFYDFLMVTSLLTMLLPVYFNSVKDFQMLAVSSEQFFKSSFGL